MTGNRNYDDPRYKYNDSRFLYDGRMVTPRTESNIEYLRKKTGKKSVKPKAEPTSSRSKSKGWDNWTTTPSPTQASAFLGIDKNLGHTFRFNPEEVIWDYTNNVFSQDTLGGRVIQLLSVSLNSLKFAGRAGNRKEYQRLAKNIKAIMGYHVNTLEPVEFRVPSRNWHFKVYLTMAPAMGWTYKARAYTYEIDLLVEEDLNGIKTKELNTQVLKRLAAGIGYDYSKHGGDAYTYKRQYEILTQSQANGEDVDDSEDVIGVQPVDCKGNKCDVTSFMTAVAQCVSGESPDPKILSVLIKWAAAEGGSVHNSYDYNLLNTLKTEGVDYTKTGNFPSYKTFQDGVKATCDTIRQENMAGIAKGIKGTDPKALAVAIAKSPWCAGGCYNGGKDLLGDPGSYGKNILP